MHLFFNFQSVRIYYVASSDFVNTILFLAFILKYSLMSKNITKEVEKDIVQPN